MIRIRIPIYDPEQGTYYGHTVIGAQDEEGLRLLLGENGAHDLLIERWPDKWLALLHPNAGDACLIIEIHDNVLLVTDEYGKVLMRKEIYPGD